MAQNLYKAIILHTLGVQEGVGFKVQGSKSFCGLGIQGFLGSGSRMSRSGVDLLSVCNRRLREGLGFGRLGFS